MRSKGYPAAIACLAAAALVGPGAAAADPINIHFTGLLLLASDASGVQVFVPPARGHEARLYFDCGSPLFQDGEPNCADSMPLPSDLQSLRLSGVAAPDQVVEALTPDRLLPGCALDPGARPALTLPPAAVVTAPGPLVYTTSGGDLQLAELYTYRGEGVDPTLGGLPLEPHDGEYDLVVSNTTGGAEISANRYVLTHMLELTGALLDCRPSDIKIPVSVCCLESEPGCSLCGMPMGSGPVRCPPVWNP